jgi:LPXTG-site transpeptidase (sortase) family protein
MMPTTDEGAALLPDDPAPEVDREGETLEQYLGRVEAPRLVGRRRARTRRPWRRTVRTLAVVAVIAASAALPWVAPQVPGFLAGLVPGGGPQAQVVEDPPVGPSTDAFIGPIGVSSQAGPYDGVRLESSGQPREVVVRRLHVDSTVVPISGQSGTLLPPSDPKVLGWWQEGRPVGAAEGTAVVTGHTVHTGGGALDHLDKLVVGDVVRVRTDRGWITYTVQRNRIYSRAALARDAESVFRLDGPGRLVLITCDEWNGSFYESNAVVFAVPVDDQPFVSNSETPVPDVGPAAGRAAPSGNMEDPRGVLAAKMFDR